MTILNVYIVTLSSVESSEDTVTHKVISDNAQNAISAAHMLSGHWYTDLNECKLIDIAGA